MPFAVLMDRSYVFEINIFGCCCLLSFFDKTFGENAIETNRKKYLVLAVIDIIKMGRWPLTTVLDLEFQASHLFHVNVKINITSPGVNSRKDLMRRGTCVRG